jgi:hypothetical protein
MMDHSPSSTLMLKESQARTEMRTRNARHIPLLGGGLASLALLNWFPLRGRFRRWGTTPMSSQGRLWSQIRDRLAAGKIAERRNCAVSPRV